jgi:glycosyltransferase involved in cell wall biosynthesis
MRSKRIVIVATRPEAVGGQAVQVRLLADHLRRDGHAVSVVPVNPAHRLAAIGRIPYARTIVNQCFYLPRLLALWRADVVHVFSASYWSFLLAPLPAILAGRAFGRRVVLHYHSGEAADHLRRWGVLVHPWLRLCAEIVVPSEYLREVFRSYGYPCRVIPNIVDTSDFRFRDRPVLRPALLSSRNLEPYYRVDNTVRAFALLRRRFADATLTVAGQGREAAKLAALAAALGADGVRFVGAVDHPALSKLCDAADVFVNSSVLDNQPVSVLEAFAAGLPVVSTPPGDIPAMVRGGEAGVLVPPGDPEAMAEAITRLLENPSQAARLARAAREELARYSWPGVRHAWAEVYAGGRS